MTDLGERLAAGEVLILDGATGTELERRGVPMDDAAWCGAANLEHGDTLCAVHADYIRAGAEIVIANTYATGRRMLEAAGLGEQVREVNLAAVAAARAARDEVGADQRVWVAGSISVIVPFSDHGRRPPLADQAAQFREQAELLAEGGCELLILEMMRDLEHTQAAIRAAAATGLPVWVGFSCVRDAGRRLVMAPGIAEDLPFDEVVAPAMSVGGSLLAVMHSEVADAAPALEIARRHWDGPLGAYPHSGHFVMPNWQFDEIVTPEDYLAAAEGWVASGVQVVGGCCGIGPEHIRLLAERLPRRIG